VIRSGRGSNAHGIAGVTGDSLNFNLMGGLLLAMAAFVVTGAASIAWGA